MKDLSEILKKLDTVSVSGNTACKVSGIVFDSRKVEKDSLFVAIKGTRTDGHQYISSVISAGASAVICEQKPESIQGNAVIIVVEDSAKALGIVSSAFFDNPSSSIRLVGVTGTNGKTTIATLLFNMFRSLGYKCGLFSTVTNFIEDVEYPATHTTPDPVQLNRLLAEMVSAGCEYAFMEVSSHAVAQSRIEGLTYTGGVFTNLTHDHLDYHKTFENYLAAKKSFFDNLPESSFALTNSDDRNGSIMVQNCRAAKFTYSSRGMADFRASVIEQRFEGMGIRIDGHEVWTRFIGDFNVSNLLAVYGASVLLGADKHEALRVLSNLHPVQGRLETVRTEAPVTGIVDYAHTPDALMNVIETINRIRQGGKSLITVIGAGGDRDRTKRPKMAEIAARGSDRTILTSDNPRTEDPEMILNDMEAGVPPELRKKVLRITDRREAIKAAVMMASAGDVILVAGKGHETYQEINGNRQHFDDREELGKAMLMKI